MDDPLVTWARPLEFVVLVPDLQVGAVERTAIGVSRALLMAVCGLLALSACSDGGETARSELPSASQDFEVAPTLVLDWDQKVRTDWDRDPNAQKAACSAYDRNPLEVQKLWMAKPDGRPQWAATEDLLHERCGQLGTHSGMLGNP